MPSSLTFKQFICWFCTRNKRKQKVLQDLLKDGSVSQVKKAISKKLRNINSPLQYTPVKPNRATPYLTESKQVQSYPLILAVANGNVEIVKYLITEGADVTVCEREASALQCAISRKQKELVRILLKAGCLCYQSSTLFPTPLNAILSYTRTYTLEDIQYLIEAGYDIQMDNAAATSLHTCTNRDIYRYYLNIISIPI